MNAGIIAEYNPFHNGHKLHLEKTKSDFGFENCIVVMSGNFVQRGEPAIFDKWVRTEMALLNGADMVLELPVCYATAGADMFAFGAVSLLEKTGIIDGLCFGSETGNINMFSEVSELLSNEPEIFSEILKKELDNGVSFPKARFNALSKVLNKELGFLTEPNNILGLEYLIAIKKIGCAIKPFAVKREGSHYHSKELSGEIASATAIREAIRKMDTKRAAAAVPLSCMDIFTEALEDRHYIDDYTSVLSYILKTKPKEYIASICDVSEGLENRIILNAGGCIISELIDRIKTKRYTRTKLQRAVLHIILDMKKIDLETYGFPYIRVLGFRMEKEYLLKEMIRKADIPVLTNMKKEQGKLTKEEDIKKLLKDIVFTDIYFLNDMRKYEFSKPIVIV